ncbi:MAG: MFS transporter [Candidatus Limnocylindria bacterium]
MLIAGIVIGLLAGLLLGGRPGRLLDVRLHAPILLFLAVAIRYGTELALRQGMPYAEELRLPLFATGFLVLAYGLWLNRDQPGLLVAAAGVAANGFAMIVNGGWMPVWQPALAAAGLTTADLVPNFQRLLPNELGLPFLLQAGPLGDVLPIPLPILRNVASVGDVFISVGLGWFVFSTLVGFRVGRPGQAGATGQPAPPPATLGTVSLRAGRGGAVTPGQPTALVTPQTGLVVSDAYSAALAFDRTAVFGGSGTVVPRVDLRGPGAPVGRAIEAPALPTAVVRAGQHPFVRLAQDARFSAFWLGQTISFFGDRLNQIALGVLVLAVTNSALATALVFVTAAIPNLLLAPIAGTFVDRWDQKAVMVVSDFGRAALVLLIPIAATADIWLVFPIVFLVTCISVFFRPAKSAVVPRIVAREDLMAANSALWTSETLADIAGYPLAGIFVALLGSALTIAFWVDAATYVVSGVVIMGLTIPPVIRAAAPAVSGALRRFGGELREGLRFLRDQPSLYQNTLVSALAQMSIGALVAITVVYARDSLDPRVIPYPTNWSLLETAAGVGNLIGGLAVGLIGARFGKGWLVCFGLLFTGVGLVIMGLTANPVVAIAATAVTGIANLVYVIPTQTLFAELTPHALMGRVVAFRSGLVYGSLTIGMAISGVLASVLPAGAVLAGFGVLTVGCGVAALFLPAIRDS